MSTVRYFDSVPHIARYGMHDDKNGGKSRTLFYRNGVCFKINVAGGDVSGTAFADTWSKLLGRPDVSDQKQSWIAQWDALCDCVITPCLPLLETLAPSSHQWVTLHDYIHTPTYDLKLVADEAKTGDVVPEITDGPTDRPSYEHHLMHFAEISSLSEHHVTQYRAGDLVVLGQDKNWRRPPHKVRAPSGDVFFFRACNRPSRNVSTGQITNSSLDVINAFLRLYPQSSGASSSGAAEGVNIPRLQGVVVSHANAGLEESTAPSAADEGQAKQQEEESLCAGILTNFVPGAKTLAELIKLSNNRDQTIDLSKYKEKWKDQIALAIKHLHDHRITVGGRSGANAWYLINQHTIRVAPKIDGDDKPDNAPGADFHDADAWLTLSGGCTVHPLAEGNKEEATDGEKFKEEQAMDWAALEKVFQF
ncbi:hypothetical protein AYL99_00231 [Fonsecaea erecta]|uniref:Uncharacterized protein n=1 Tax=Fonsecaea erecta TaxID=1367422 RepID=A0A178ZWQ9_9EURO|nr:hypothetical protein AYL99_00231 [Fonsecaea erecta]OAP64259.1 hypothetical protein AYL99_00231 [Fonsecaea erecta]